VGKTLLVGDTRNLLVQATSSLLVGVSTVSASTGRASVTDRTTYQTIRPSTGRLVLGSRTVEFELERTLGKVAVGGTVNIQFNRRNSGASVLQCCVDASSAGGRVTFGAATWDASPLQDGDGMARYHPLWLDDHEVLEANELPNPAAAAAQLATLQSVGRDIAHELDAAGVGPIMDSVDGKMCEIPEQFRLGRYYDVPLAQLLDPQPRVPIGAPPIEPPVLQWEWSRGFTASMLYRYRPVRQEQSLFSLSPAVRFGVSWLGELTIEVTLKNGDKQQAWSTQRLSSIDWSHIAFTLDSHRNLVAVHLNGLRVVELSLAQSIGLVDGCYIGRWNGGSLLNGEAQDVRIYNSVLRSEFIAAEVDSYCADWVEVV
jgi:hypothetical protein